VAINSQSFSADMVPFRPQSDKEAFLGQVEFDSHYAGLYGDRWPALRAALLAEGCSVAFSGVLAKAYYLDVASVAAACALDLSTLPPEGLVLDACAAPGGKTLVLASRLAARSDNCSILANELSSDRRRRLSVVLDTHLPAELRQRVRVSGFDAAAAGGRRSEHGRFAAILLDAPCSSERHVLADAQALAQWSPARIKSLAQRQWSLLSSAFLLLADGGSLVYSTCALSPAENDQVVGRLFKKYGQAVQSFALPLSIQEALHSSALPAAAIDFAATGHIQAEATEYGVLYLPDQAMGAGPLYIAALRKV